MIGGEKKDENSSEQHGEDPGSTGKRYYHYQPQTASQDLTQKNTISTGPGERKDKKHDSTLTRLPPGLFSLEDLEP